MSAPMLPCFPLVAETRQLMMMIYVQGMKTNSNHNESIVIAFFFMENGQEHK
jgi:hypothetical protein